MQPPRTVMAGIEVASDRAAVLGLASWHVVVAVAAMTSQEHAVALALAHAGLAVAAAVSGLMAPRPIAVLVATWALMVVDLVASVDRGGLLAFVAMWTGITTAATPVLVCRGWIAWAAPPTVVVLTGSTVTVAQPTWGSGVVVAIAVSAAALVLMTVVLVAGLRRIGDDADWAASRLAEDQDRLRRAGLAHCIAADHARVVHDTVVNTFGAIASGAGLTGTADVRRRCEQDLQVLASAWDDVGGDAATGLAAVADGIGVTLQRTGLDDGTLRELTAHAPPSHLGVLRSMVREVIINVDKHAGVDEAVLDVTARGDRLEVVVRDRGQGFYGSVPADGGLATSVLARGNAAGFDVAIDSRPDDGTAVTIAVPLVTTEDDADDVEGAAPVAHRLEWTSLWVWVVGLIGAGVAFELAAVPVLLSLDAALLTGLAILALCAWSLARDRHEVPGWFAVLLVLAAPVAFMVALVSVDGGRGDLFGWQVVSGNAALVLVTVLVRPRIGIQVALGCLAAVVVGSMILVGSDDPSSAVTVAVGAGLMVSLFGGWPALFGHVDAVTAELDRVRLERLAARSLLDERAAAAAARRRWEAVGLDRAVDLLSDLSRGDVDPSGPEVRHECARQERLLRQMLGLPADLVRLGPWFATGLRSAHDRWVALTVQVGAPDVEDEQTAATVGNWIATAVERSRPSDDLTVGWFEVRGRPHLLISGRAGLLEGTQDALALPDGWCVRTETHDGRDFVELGPGVMARSGR